MRLILKIALKDLRRRMRAPLSVISMILIPIVLTFIVGMVFGGSGDTKIEGIKVLFVNEDSGMASSFIGQGFSQSQLSELVHLETVDREKGMELINKGKASALIIVPEGFTDSLLNDATTRIEIIENPSEVFLPLIVEEILKTEIVMLEAILDIFSDPISSVRSFIEEDRMPRTEEVSEMINLSRDRIELIVPYLRDSLLTVDVGVRHKEKEGAGGDIFSFTFVGSFSIGLLFISMIALGDILREKNSGTLKRILSTPATVTHFVFGKVLFNILLTAVALVILLSVAKFLFNATFAHPLAIFLLCLGVVLMFPAILTFIYGFVRNERIASSIIPMIIVVLCMTGGAMIPYEQMGGFLKAIAPYSPVFWVVDGLKKLLSFGKGLDAIGTNLLVIYLIAAITMIAGIALNYSRIRRET